MRVSHSSIQSFKDCRRKWYFRYKERIVPNKEPTEALEVGITFHSMLAKFYSKDLNDSTGGVRGSIVNLANYIYQDLSNDDYSFAKDKITELALNGDLDLDIDIESMSQQQLKSLAMFIFFLDVEAIGLTNWADEQTKSEEWFEIPLDNGMHSLGGFIDAQCYDSVIEFKTTSAKIGEDYVYKFEFVDEQILSYLLAKPEKSNARVIVIQKPTIRLSKNESNIDFVSRCLEWLKSNTNTSIKDIYIEKSKKDLEDHYNYLCRMADEMEYCDNFYRNNSACMRYGSLCEYASICGNYEQYKDNSIPLPIMFTKKEE